jgi:hypothetical protein
LARHAFDQLEVASRRRSPDDDDDYAFTAPLVVITAAAAMEAGANEVADWFSHHPTRPVAFPDDFDDLPLETKWSVIPVIAKLDPFKKGERPWQDFHSLVSIRNALMHPRPGRSLDTVIRLLQSRGALRRNWPKSDQFGAILTRGTAAWAIDTVAKMFRALDERVGPEWRQSRTHRWLWGLLQDRRPTS